LRDLSFDGNNVNDALLRCTNRFNGFCKPLTASRKSIPHLSNAKLHLTKSQQVDYQIFGNILNRDYLNFNTPKS